MPRVYADEDLAYFRCLEAERIELVGPTAEYYSLNRGKNVDPLYGEPDNDPLYGGSSSRGTPQKDEKSWNFYPNPNANPAQPALTFPVAMEYQESENKAPSVRDEGFILETDAIMYLSYNHWIAATTSTEIDGRVPKEGDVVYCDLEWWDVVRVGGGGYVVDTPQFVGWRFELKKRSKFTPDRKVDR